MAWNRSGGGYRSAGITAIFSLLEVLSSMKILLIIFLLIALSLSGCVTTLELSTRGKPQEITPIVVVEADRNYYKEAEFEVPEEIRDEDFDVISVDIWADILVVYLNSPVEVKLYIGLESGQYNLDDSDKNTLLVQKTVSQAGRRNRINVDDPDLIFKALNQDKFYLKAVAVSENRNNALVRVTNIYMNIKLERETNGLLPFLYFF